MKKILQTFSRRRNSFFFLTLVSLINLTISCSSTDDGGKVDSKESLEPLNLSILQDKFEVSREGGSFEIQVSSNAEYTVTTIDNWLHLTPNPSEGKVAVSVDENTATEKRVGHVNFLVEGKIVKVVEVSQEAAVSYFIPFLSFGTTAEQVKTFEQERNSVLNREHDITGTGTQLAYTISDEIFNEVNYLIGLKGLQQASLFVKDGTLTEENKNSYEEFLISQGFVKQTLKGYENTLSLAPKDKEVFINEQQQVRAELMTDRNHNHYRFTYYPVQLRDYPTFAEFPYFEKEITRAQVEEYERTKYGQSLSEKSQINYGEVGKMKDKLYFEGDGRNTYARIYYVYHEGQTRHGLVQISHYYADHSLALYQGVDGGYYLTREFIKLAKDNGYEYERYTAKYGYTFYNSSLNKRLYVLWYKDETFNWTLRINIY